MQRGTALGRMCVSVCLSVCPVRALTTGSLYLETSCTQVHLQNILVILVYQGHRVKVKVTRTKNTICERNWIHTFAGGRPPLIERQSCFVYIMRIPLSLSLFFLLSSYSTFPPKSALASPPSKQSAVGFKLQHNVQNGLFSWPVRFLGNLTYFTWVLDQTFRAQQTYAIAASYLQLCRSRSKATTLWPQRTLINVHSALMRIRGFSVREFPASSFFNEVSVR